MSRLVKAMTVGLLIGVAGLLGSLTPVGFDLEEHVGLALLFRWRGTRPAPSEVVIVSIDKDSATQLHFPSDPEQWSRLQHARLTTQLAQAGATVIAFDIIFDKARDAGDDQAFANAMQQAGNVVLFEYLDPEIIPVPDKGGPPKGVLHLERLVPPLPLLAHAAVAFAPFPLPKVPVRVNQYWTFKTGAGGTPTLPVVAFQLVALEVYDEFLRVLDAVHPSHALTFPRDKATILSTTGLVKFIGDVRGMFLDEPRLAESMLDALHKTAPVSLDRTQRRLLISLIKMYQSVNTPYLNFYGYAGTVTTLPYYRALQISDTSLENLETFDFQGKTVFVGFSERLRPAQKDGFHTVFSQASGVDISGVEIAATAFANLLEGLPIQPLSWPWHIATLWLWGIAVGMLCYLLPTVLAAVSALGLGTLYLFTAQQQFAATGAWYPLTIPVFVQVPLAFFSATLWKYFDTSKERRHMQQAFRYYVPEALVEQFAKRLASVPTSRQLVYGTCLFTDAEQYTAVAERMDPEALGSFMNAYYATMFEPVRHHQGIVSDVVGDAMLAIWATGQPDASMRREACLAALDIAHAVEQFLLSSGTWQLPTRIGLHAGQMLLANIGALDHYEYRAVGDMVNTASRLDGLNKFLGTRILVSAEVLHELEGFLTRELGTFLLVGKAQSLVVHELLCRLEDAQPQQRRLCTLFAGALEAYNRQAWHEAIDQFSAICVSSLSQQDGPSLFYVELCQRYRANPPKGTWNGVVRVVHK